MYAYELALCVCVCCARLQPSGHTHPPRFYGYAHKHTDVEHTNVGPLKAIRQCQMVCIQK